MQSSSKSSIAPETLSQAGAGALLAVVGVVELWLTAAAAGWWYQCGSSLVAAAGVALLARGVAAMAPALRLDAADRLASWAAAPAPKPEPEPARRVLLAE